MGHTVISPGLFLGVGAISWLTIESMLLQRAATLDPHAEAMRPSLGVQLAPPVVGGVAYMGLTTGAPDLVAMMLLGYGLFQALVLLRLVPWITKQAFAPSYWAFSFGVAALPTLAMRMVEHGATGSLETLAVALFVAANVIIAGLMVKTVALLVEGRFLPMTGSSVSAAAAPKATKMLPKTAQHAS